MWSVSQLPQPPVDLAQPGWARSGEELVSGSLYLRGPGCEVQGWRRLSVCVCPLHMARVLTSVRLSSAPPRCSQATSWTLEGGHWADTDKILKKCYAKCAINMAFSTKAQKFNKLRWSVDDDSKGLPGICDCQELVSRGETFKPWIVARVFRGHFCFTEWHGTLFTKELSKD